MWAVHDPGWAHGLYDAVIGPLLIGHQTTLFDGPFSVDSTVSLIEELGVTNLAGAPTAYRMMIAAGAFTSAHSCITAGTIFGGTTITTRSGTSPIDGRSG